MTIGDKGGGGSINLIFVVTSFLKGPYGIEVQFEGHFLTVILFPVHGSPSTILHTRLRVESPCPHTSVCLQVVHCDQVSHCESSQESS